MTVFISIFRMTAHTNNDFRSKGVSVLEQESNNKLAKYLEPYYLGCIHHISKLQLPSNATTIGGGIRLPHSDCILKCHFKESNVAVSVRNTGQCLCDFDIGFEHTDAHEFQYKGTCTEGLRIFSTSVIEVEPTQCSGEKTELNGNAEIIALGSYPGSGNTWIRFLLELATGISTGSVYTDGSLFKQGFKGEKLAYDSGKTLVVKDHFIDFLYKYHSAILIIRNPFDAIVSRFNWQKTHSHVKRVPETILQSQDFKQFAVEEAPIWTDVIKRVLEENDEVLVIYYEEVKSDVIRNLRNILNFLPPQNLNLDPNTPYLTKQIQIERMLQCLENKDGNFKRKSSETTNLIYYYPPTKDVILTQLIHVNTLLYSHNQPVLPDSYFT